MDGSLSNPLDQKLHTLLGHHQYISPNQPLSFTCHTLYTIQYSPETLHNQHNTYYIHQLHIQHQLHTTTTHLHTINWSCTLMQVSCNLMQVSCGCMQIPCSLIQVHADTCTLYPYFLWFCWTSLIWYRGLSYFCQFFITLHPLFLTGCACTWTVRFFSLQFWLFHCVPWHFQASKNPSV